MVHQDILVGMSIVKRKSMHQSILASIHPIMKTVFRGMQEVTCLDLLFSLCEFRLWDK